MWIKVLLHVVLCPLLDTIHLKDWENQILHRKHAKHTHKHSNEENTIVHKVDPTVQTQVLNNPDKLGDEIQKVQDLLSTISSVIVVKPEDEASISSKGSNKLHLFGPLHGPDWILRGSDIPHLRPVTGSNGVEGTFLWAVGLFGTVQNGATTITVMSSRRCRRPLHILVGMLSFTDLFISMVYIPSYTYFLLEGVPVNTTKQPSPASPEAQSEWNFCRISRSMFVQIASVTLTVKSLIALYLYIYTTSRQQAEKLFRPGHIVAYITLAWILNFLVLFTPQFLGLSVGDFYPNAKLCIDNWQEQPVQQQQEQSEYSGVVYSLLTLSFHILQLLLMCACFIKVHLAIRAGSQSIWQKQQTAARAATYRRASRTTVLLFATFMLCWLPIYVVNMVDPFHSHLPPVVHHVAMDLLLMKSALNPAIFIYSIKSLRRELKIMCLCRCRDPNARQINFRAPRSSSLESCQSKSTHSGEDV